ncbi:NACHT domain-containing protein [Methylomonas sp. MK1]|uniref:NACHT domain-containing protein n=1 Tax=Methylomonas sp. MK1 TaxID=1131552 RepID=UPI000363E4FB|nr:hypothetical protein [Methylomonas sp. MK1]
MSEDIISLSLGEKWITALWKKLSSIKKTRESELNKINDEILFSDPLELAKVYIEPFCQEVNPADRHDEDFFISREPLFKKISEFLRLKTYQQGNNQLFILSDAGMGKTSFLVMLKLLHLTSFWPKGYHCVLEKLSENTLLKISDIENKRKTVLLLDSLDEDPSAHGRVRERLLDILSATKNFNRVIITCRTQFFPSVEKDPLELPGRIRIDNFICPSKYLSIFDDDQVNAYLDKRFPRRFLQKSSEKKEKANSIINRMTSLRCRPMLLSFIEDLVNSPKFWTVGSEYSIYNSLVENWLLREQTKADLNPKVLMHACAQLAFELQSKKAVKISSKDLDELIASLELLEMVKAIDIKGRSLLNKNSSGEYRFSHYSIQEFLVVFYIFNYARSSDSRSIYPTDFIKNLLEQNKSQLLIRLQDEGLRYHEEVEAWENNSVDIDQYIFHGKKEVSELIGELVSEIDELDIQPYESELDIPTFLRRQVKSISDNKSFVYSDRTDLNIPSFLRRKNEDTNGVSESSPN